MNVKMVKKVFLILVITAISPLFCACDKNGSFVTSTGKLGRRAEIYKQYTVPRNNPPVQKNGVIYLGREYENNQFGPSAVKFVFEK